MVVDLIRSTVLWQLVAAGLFGFGALWWWLLGARRFARRRALRQRIAALGQPSSDSGLAALSGMRRGISDAVQGVLQPSGQPTGHALLYRVPWLLFVGDQAADVPGLLAAAHHASAQPAPPARESMADAFWRWWLLGPMTAIETHPDAVCEPSAARERSLWFQALLELAERRERLPLNGIVVCVGASALLGDPLEIDETAAQLQRLVDEASQLLQLQLPVYLVVNGLERLRGHETVLAALPPAVLAQALGHRLAYDEATGAAGAQLDQAFATMVDRLHALRMALARRQPLPADRLAIHRFVEDVTALRPGLRLLVERLFERPRHIDAPALRWRGLYFTSAAEGGASGAFVADLFQRLLPGDQPLARPTR